MASVFVGQDGKTYKPGDPGYEEARADNLEVQLRELTAAVVDLQHRVSKLDQGDIPWPGDTYEPR